MWGSSNSSKRGTARIETLVGRNTQVRGDLHFTGGLHVDGTVKGNVVAEAGSDSVLSLSQHGRIEGEVHVPDIHLDGTVVGDVFASGRIELGEHAEVKGNVHYNLIEMAVGATVNGKMVHKPESPVLALSHGANNRQDRAEEASDDRAAEGGGRLD